MDNISQTQADDQNEIESLDPFAAKMEVLQYDQPNPFYIPINGSDLKYTKTKFLADEYKNVYVLCLSNDFEASTQNKNKIKLFYEPDTEVSELKGQSKLVTLIQGPFPLVHLHNIRAGLVSVGKEVLEYFNHDSNELNNKEIVYLMLETKEFNVRSWIKLYESESNLDKFIEQKIFTSYYKLDDKTSENNLLALIGQVGDFKYWQNERNCSLTVNNAFNDRKFNLSFMNKWNLPTEEIEKELQKLLQNFKETKSKLTNNSNYPAQMTDPKNKMNKPKKIIEPIEQKPDPLKMNNYVDGSKTDLKSFFGIVKTEELAIKKESVEELLLNYSLSEKEKYYLICNLLASKNYCHYVLGNSKIMNANKELLEKYKPIMKYLIGYAWISLYMEESLKKTRTKQTDRFVLDIDTAALLPVFPFCSDAPHLNPYFTSMVSDQFLNPGQNIHGVKQSAEYQNGIVNLAEFKRRLNIFTSKKADVNLLEGADWTNMVITGGTMAAIMPKTNPLMALFRKTADPTSEISEQELNRFFQEYYSKSDVDMACNHSNILDFIEHVKNIKNIIQSNLGQNIKDGDIEVTPTKTLAIYINAGMLKEKCDRGEIPFKYDYVVANKNKRSVKFYFYEDYIEQKKMANISNKKILGDKINDDEYFEIIDYCDFEKSVIIINDVAFESDVIENRTPESNSGIETVYFSYDKSKESQETQVSEEKSKKKTNVFIRFSETLKFKISSKLFDHPFEIFRISDVEFFSCVSRFHLPCVRSYYNGTNCYLLPSAVTAYQTFTNIDFKYFVGSKDPISIIDKYRKRGYGTLLNKTEINQYLSYIMAVDNFKRAYGVAQNDEIKNIVGSLDVNHEFFKPRKNIPEDFSINPNIKLDYSAPKLDYLKNKEDLFKVYKKRYMNYSSEFLEKKTIGSNGQIEPMKLWMIDASYDLLN